MAESEGSKLRFETWLVIGFVVAMILSTTVIVVTNSSKSTVFSAYVTDSENENIQHQQISIMREDIAEDGYVVANTMSTPMLVNDWREPHRTLMVITAPEKPFDAAEAEAIHDFVTEKGGKVVIASNSTNAQRVAQKFGVSYFDAPVADLQRYYEVEIDGQSIPDDVRKTYAIASINKNLGDVDSSQTRIPCGEENVVKDDLDECYFPVLFHRPTAIQLLNQGDDQDSNREVKVLAHASPGAYLAYKDFNINDPKNPLPGDVQTGYVVRIDYPGIDVVDKVVGEREDEVQVTGSIIFVSDHSAFANHLWDRDTADLTGKQQCISTAYDEDKPHNCWDSGPGCLSDSAGDVEWNGNSFYFSALLRDMMEVDNEKLSATITRHNDQFYVVFDESRHVTSSLSAPFTEAMGAIVMLTSDTLLKWLIILNLMALLSIAIMVVPEKENWRHVFDLTRFRERPNKVDSDTYLQRVRESLMTKVRNFNDLTRDEMVRKTPAEVQSMIKDPRLIELLYSQQRSYSNEELRQILQQIRRWGK